MHWIKIVSRGWYNSKADAAILIYSFVCLCVYKSMHYPATKFRDTEMVWLSSSVLVLSLEASWVPRWSAASSSAISLWMWQGFQWLSSHRFKGSENSKWTQSYTHWFMIKERFISTFHPLFYKQGSIYKVVTKFALMKRGSINEI